MLVQIIYTISYVDAHLDQELIASVLIGNMVI